MQVGINTILCRVLDGRGGVSWLEVNGLGLRKN